MQLFRILRRQATPGEKIGGKPNSDLIRSSGIDFSYSAVKP